MNTNTSRTVPLFMKRCLRFWTSFLSSLNPRDVSYFQSTDIIIHFSHRRKILKHTDFSRRAHQITVCNTHLGATLPEWRQHRTKECWTTCYGSHTRERGGTRRVYEVFTLSRRFKLSSKARRFQGFSKRWVYKLLLRINKSKVIWFRNSIRIHMSVFVDSV